MAQMSLEELYRGEGVGEKYGIMGEVMKDFFQNGCPSEYDERTWLEMLLVKHALMAAEKMKNEAESIFLWAFEGLQRLVRQNFKFTESPRIKANRENVKWDNNNVLEFLESEGYIRFQTESSASSKELYESYRLWCEENFMTALKNRSFSDAMIAVQTKYNLVHCNTIKNSAGRRVWGFTGVEVITKLSYTDGLMDASECTYVPKEWTN